MQVLRPRSLAMAVRAAVWAMACGAGIATAQPATQNAPAQWPGASAQALHGFQVDAGPLHEALAAFAAQSGVSVAMPPDVLQGRRSPGVRGRYNVAEGFARLLAGTGLQAVASTSGGATTAATYVLRHMPEAASGNAGATPTLAEVRVTALAEPGASSESTRSYTSDVLRAATGMPLSMRETPQSVSVITRQRIEDQRLESLDDVLRTTTGITSTYNGSERASWYARGERVDTLQIDGLPLSIADGFSTDSLSLPATVLYDRVEVVRGANGLLQGSGSPSAAVNMIRKRPTREGQAQLAVSAGSWANRTAQVDAGGPLNEAGTLRGRGVAYVNKANSYHDTGGKDNKVLYGILEADLTPDTTLMGGFVWQDETVTGYDWGGLPTRTDGSFFPFKPSTTLTPDWAFLEKRNRQLFAELTHRFAGDWKLTLSANKITSKSDMLGRSVMHLRANGPMEFRATRMDFDDKRENVGVHLQGSYMLGGRKHELMAGANLQDSSWFYNSANMNPRPLIDPLNFNPALVPYPSTVRGSPSFEGSRKKDTGLYLASRLDLPASNKLIVGGRLSWVDFAGFNSWSTTGSRYRANAKFTPYVGLVHTLDESTSVYASYTEIFKPQSQIDVRGNMLDPVIGSNYELGIKREFMGGALNASAALFQTVQNNLPLRVSSPGACSNQTVSCYEASDKVRNRGVEFDVSGELAEGWQLAGGYTFNQSRYVAGGASGAGGRAYATYLPRHVFKLATTWRLPGRANAWKLSAQVQAQSKTYTDSSSTGFQSFNAPYRISQKAYALVGLMASYQIDPKTELQFNVSNLFNTRYYSTLGGTNWGNLMGAPRSVAVTLRKDF